MLMFECIQERDIDLLLMEEWCVNPEFAKFFVKNIFSKNIDVEDRTAFHSITDSEHGESDVVLVFNHLKRRVAILVEDKIDAVAQPDQAKRYRLRAEKMKSSEQYDDVFICIVAPQHYLENDTEQYPHCISYECLADFLADGTSRGEYRANILRLGISQERRHPKPMKNDRVTEFWYNYYQMLKEFFPDAIMPKPKIVPSKSDWPMIRFPNFSKKMHIIHKMAQGNLDLETELSKSDLQNTLSKWNKQDIDVVQTGKSFVLRIKILPLDRMQDFYSQISSIDKAFAGIQLFRDCINKYGI